MAVSHSGGRKFFNHMNRKIIFIMGTVIVVFVLGYSFLWMESCFADYRQQTNEIASTQNYYDKLANDCRKKQSRSCCLASVEAMRSGNYTLAPQEGCPAGYRPNMMKCRDSYRWCQPAIDSTTQSQTENARKVFQDSRYTFQFEYPSKWSIENQQGTSRILILKDEANMEIITVDTGVNLSIMGISYCGAYPQDKRCEVLKTENVNFVTIDWDVSGEANAMFSSQDGTYGVSFTLHKINSNTKTIFKKVLSTFKFVK